MYVCLCKGITDHQIKAAIEDGATSMGKLRKALDVAGQCGKCGVMTREILQDTLAQMPLIDGYPQYHAA